MKKIKFALYLLLVFTYGCKEQTNQENKAKAEKGKFSFVLENVPQTYLVREINDYYSAAVVSQISECLVKLDPKTLDPIPALAESWDVADGGLSYVFHLRKGVKFHDHSCFPKGKGREFNSSDVVYSYELDASKNDKNEGSHAYNSFLKGELVGAEDFFEGKATSIAGIEVKDKYTVVFHLLQADQNFIDKMASVYLAIVAKEVVECGKETDLIGTGPFMYASEVSEPIQHIILKRNPNYYLKDKEGRQLPYLDTVVIYIENNQLEQLSMFEDGTIDFIQDIPPSKITHMLEERIKDFSGEPPLMKLSDDPLLSTQYYGLNMESPALKDIRVRQALNYAVNREKIITNVLNNHFLAGTYGIVPPLKKEFPNYDFETLGKDSYSYNPEKARELLAAAGYPNGKGFPSLTLKFNLGTIHSAVADEFRKQMQKELNININIEGLSFEEKIEEEQMGKGDIFRTSWYADYKSAESFLINFYGKVVPIDKKEPSKINATRYNNAQFDKFFEEAQVQSDIKKRNELFSKAEDIMMKDAPVIILWYGEQYIMQNFNVRNLETNSILSIDLTRVKIQDWTHDEYIAKFGEQKK